MDLEVLLACLAVALLSLTFLELANLVGAGSNGLDDALLLMFRQPGHPDVARGGEALTAMMRDVTALGSGTVTGLFAIGLTGYLLVIGRPRAALFVVVAVLGAWCLNAGLKELFARERPSVVTHLMSASEASFPSGHTMISSTFYPTLAELVALLVPHRRGRFYGMGVAIALASLIGVSRMYLGVHYPSDVVAGLCAGLSWALICGLCARWLQRRRLVEPNAAPSDQAPRGPAGL
jgi:undecaprenyl-diphosphatase